MSNIDTEKDISKYSITLGLRDLKFEELADRVRVCDSKISCGDDIDHWNYSKTKIQDEIKRRFKV